jgi:hypothetical protein
MNRINIYCWLIALSIIIFGGFYIKYLNNALDKEKVARKLCETQLKEKTDAEISSSKLIKELRQKALADKPVVDCYNSPMPEYVVSELSKLK